MSAGIGEAPGVVAFPIPLRTFADAHGRAIEVGDSDEDYHTAYFEAEVPPQPDADVSRGYAVFELEVQVPHLVNEKFQRSYKEQINKKSLEDLAVLVIGKDRQQPLSKGAHCWILSRKHQVLYCYVLISANTIL